MMHQHGSIEQVGILCESRAGAASEVHFTPPGPVIPTDSTKIARQPWVSPGLFWIRRPLGMAAAAAVAGADDAAGVAHGAIGEEPDEIRQQHDEHVKTSDAEAGARALLRLIENLKPRKMAETG